MSGTPIFSSFSEGEFYASDQIEDEAVIGYMVLDYCPVKRGSLRMKLHVLGKLYLLEDDGANRVYAHQMGFWRGLWRGLTGRGSFFFGRIDYAAGRITLPLAGEADYQYNRDVVENGE